MKNACSSPPSTLSVLARDIKLVISQADRTIAWVCSEHVIWASGLVHYLFTVSLLNKLSRALLRRRSGALDVERCAAVPLHKISLCHLLQSVSRALNQKTASASGIKICLSKAAPRHHAPIVRSDSGRYQALAPQHRRSLIVSCQLNPGSPLHSSRAVHVCCIWFCRPRLAASPRDGICLCCTRCIAAVSFLRGAARCCCARSLPPAAASRGSLRACSPALPYLFRVLIRRRSRRAAHSRARDVAALLPRS